MECAYCSMDKKSTKEHIFPDSILDIFAECDISIRGDNTFKADLVIKDVCKDCNNGLLHELDNLGGEFIKKHFVHNYNKDTVPIIEYKYEDLVKWLLKIAYNTERSYKRNTELYTRFKKYIMNDVTVNNDISLFSGIVADSTLFPEFLFDNKKLEIIISPKLIAEGILQPMDTMATSFKVREKLTPMIFPELIESYLIRLGSGVFLIFLWAEDTDKNKIKLYEKLIDKMFPYNLLSSNQTKAELHPVTHAYNINSLGLIDSELGMSFANNAWSSFMNNEKIEEFIKTRNENWDKEVEKIRLKAAEDRKKT